MIVNWVTVRNKYFFLAFFLTLAFFPFALWKPYWSGQVMSTFSLCGAHSHWYRAMLCTEEERRGSTNFEILNLSDCSWVWVCGVLLTGVFLNGSSVKPDLTAKANAETFMQAVCAAPRNPARNQKWFFFFNLRSQISFPFFENHRQKIQNPGKRLHSLFGLVSANGYTRTEEMQCLYLHK